MLNKKYKKYAFPALMILAMILLGVSMQSTLSGFSTLSLTQGTQYISSDPFFDGKPAYNLVVVVDGSSGSARGTITPDMIGDYTGANRPAGSFDLTIIKTNETCKYAVQTTDSFSVYSYSPLPQIVGTGDGQGGWYNLGSGCVQSYSCGDRNCPSGYVCVRVAQNKIGEVYRIDSVAQYDMDLNTTLKFENEELSVLLSNQQKVAEIPNTLKVSLLGTLQGSQSCPVPSSDTVLYRPINTNTLIPKSSAYISSLIQYASVPASEAVRLERQTTINAFLASTGFSSKYCPNIDYNTQETIYSCTPQSSVGIPLMQLKIKADTLGIVVPSSTPKILSVGTELIAPATTYQIPITIKNVGSETDSFDVNIIGKREVNTQPVRISLNAGEIKDITVPLQGSGIIGEYTAVATSVNSPLKKDEYPFRLMIDMFCDKEPEAGKIKVSTEKGCQYVCENQYQTDLREATCEKFGAFETRSMAYNRTEQVGLQSDGSPNFRGRDFVNEFHCTGIGTYTTLNNYMDAVLTDKKSPYIPQKIENAVWISAPTCDYVGEYGYEWNGFYPSSIQEIEYTATPQLSKGSENEIIVKQAELNKVSGIGDKINNTVIEYVNNTQIEYVPIEVEKETDSTLVIMFVVVILSVIGLVYLVINKKKIKQLGVFKW